MRWKCGFSAVEEKFRDEKIQSIIDRWTENAGLGRSVDLEKAQARADAIYVSQGLKAPKICHWSSPVSMTLAAETLRHGVKWVEKSYGKEIMLISNEYQQWLESLPVHLKSKKVARVARGGNAAFLFDSCGLRNIWRPTLDRDTYQWVHVGLSEYKNRFFCDSAQGVISHALNGALESSDQLYKDKMHGNPNPRLRVFDASEHCLYFAKQEIIAHLSKIKNPDSSERGFRLLALSCHAAIMTETEVWVSGSAAKVEVNDRGEVDCRAGPAIRFHDDSVLYAVNDFPVPDFYINSEQDMELESMPSDDGMRKAFLECFGVKRYLNEANAVCVARKRSSRLWNLSVANEVRSILEVDGKITKSDDGTGIHYYESFKQVKTFSEFEESLDEYEGFTINNQSV